MATCSQCGKSFDVPKGYQGVLICDDCAGMSARPAPSRVANPRLPISTGLLSLLSALYMDHRLLQNPAAALPGFGEAFPNQKESSPSPSTVYVEPLISIRCPVKVSMHPVYVRRDQKQRAVYSFGSPYAIRDGGAFSVWSAGQTAVAVFLNRR
jgi:hypothetical protein